MTANNDQWLDQLLQAPHVDDDGFVKGVVDRVPVGEEGKGKGVVLAFALMGVAAGAVIVLELIKAHDMRALVVGSLTGKLVAACAAVFAVVAAAVSGESLRLNHLRQLIAAGPAPLALPAHELDQTASAAAVPTVNLALKKHQEIIDRTEDLDEDTAREVVMAARKHRPLFGTIWFFFLAAPFILIAGDNLGIGSAFFLDVLVLMIMGGFLVGTPLVWFFSRQAFLKECEQLGISKSFARRLRWRLTVANILYSPRDERDERAVQRLRQLPAKKKK